MTILVVVLLAQNLDERLLVVCDLCGVLSD